jgi:periplasmic protein TonB
MFADSLLASSWENRSHRGWITVASFAAQLFGLALLLSLPLLFTEGLPRLRLLSPAVPFSAVPSTPPPPPQHTGRPTSARDLTGAIPFITPARIPSSIARTDEPIAPPAVDMRGTWQPDAGAGRNTGPGVPWGTGGTIAAVAPPVAHNSPPRISVMMQGNLIDRVQPSYPSIAKAAHIQGSVVLRAVISREGTIQNLQVISGHPMLVRAAMEAVKQWRYRPYVLNDQPVEVETQITVNFVLAGG